MEDLERFELPAEAYIDKTTLKEALDKLLARDMTPKHMEKWMEAGERIGVLADEGVRAIFVRTKWWQQRRYGIKGWRGLWGKEAVEKYLKTGSPYGMW